MAEKPIELHRKVVQHYRDLAALKRGLILKQAWKDFAYSSGYADVWQEYLIDRGLDHIFFVIQGKEKRRRKNRINSFGTLATRADAEALAQDGYDVKLGDPVHKDPYQCSKGQLKKMILTVEKNKKSLTFEYNVLCAIYLRRFGTQYALFDGTIEEQQRAMDRVEEDWNRLTAVNH